MAGALHKAGKSAKVLHAALPVSFISHKPGSLKRMSSDAESHMFPPRKDIMLPSGTFDGKVALVTGGGTGLGKGMAKALSSLGAKVAIMSRY